jgi:UPF0176 protein
MQLYNKLSAEERLKIIQKEGKTRLTMSFYAYAKIEDPKAFRDALFLAWEPLDVLGRIYVAHEGINAQLSLPEDELENFIQTLHIYDFMREMRLNIAVEHDDFSFLKLTIKVRHKIVADGLNDDTFDVTNKGIHLKAKDFNDLLEDPNTIVIDMRNHYESEVGHFEKAITPDVETFRESLPIIEEQLKDYKQSKNLLMYCTGGIRCEKASAYFKHKGFERVYQLEGGIIEYTRQIKADGIKSKFIGKNFVFDERLGERITDDIVSKCHQCGTPCDNHTNCANDGCHLLFIQCDDCAAKYDDCCSSTCQDIIHLPMVEQIKLRKGKQVGNKIFRKGKSEDLIYKTEANPTAIGTLVQKKSKTKKIFIGKGEHYYTQAGVALFVVEKNELKKGDTIVIEGPTTGIETLILNEFLVNKAALDTANTGDKVTFKTSFRIRKSDELYKIVSI